MSIVVENSHGWFICCKTFFDSLYCRTREENLSSFHEYRIRSIFFQIDTPFLMDSESCKLAGSKSKYDIHLKKKIAKHKKKSHVIEKDCEKIEDFIKVGASLLISEAKKVGFLEENEESCHDWFENNSKARGASSEVLSHQNPSLLANFCCESSFPHPIIKTFGSEKYLIPSLASFENCNISDYFLHEARKYDLILIDPPWVNKSVKRKRSYCQLKYDVLQNLKVEKIVNPGCLIVVWVTNSPSASAFVLDDLFPKCNVIRTAVWYWCKVTRKGKFVYPLHSHHKKPYERIILGQVSHEDSGRSSAKEIGPEKIIVSVPSSIHSHKPPLVEILKPYLSDEPQCLELFGRYLLPKWKTVGNEVLKLQNVKLFETEVSQCDANQEK